MITFCYITSRKDPRISWFFQSLERQVWEAHERQENNLQHQHTRIVVVDKWAEAQEGWTKEDVQLRREEFRNLSSTTFYHVPPKPTVWSGPHRLTTRDYFSAANARNTGLCYADVGQIVYVDDLSVLMPGWLEAVIKAVYGQYVACGVYRKVFDLEVQGGLVKSFRDSPGGHDTRLPQLDSDEVKPCSGGWLYGCSVVMPVESLLKINGWDEDCDSSGFEDCSCGFRLQRSGADIRIDPKMITWESEEGHNEGTPALRIIKPYPGWKDSSCFMENYFKFGDRIVAPNYCDIRELRQKILAGEPFPIPTEPQTDWRDGAFLKDM